MSAQCASPSRERPERAVIDGSVFVQQRPQVIARITEDEKALALDQASVALPERRGEFEQMRHRRVGVAVALMHTNRPPVMADEALIGQHALRAAATISPVRASNASRQPGRTATSTHQDTCTVFDLNDTHQPSLAGSA